MISNTISRLALGLSLACCCQPGITQSDSITQAGSPGEIYSVNYWISGGIALTGVLTNSFAHSRLRGKPGMAEEHVKWITAKGVNRFDAWSLRQDPAGRNEAAKTSDRILYASTILPFFLFLDKDIRKNWLDISLMYAEAQAINSNLYGWSPLGPTFVERYRPAVYYDELPLEERNFGNLRNSFYSGHVGSTATATFFAAKAFADYHPGLESRKYLLYALASLPPAAVGYYRIKALRHFPSDVIAGGLIGASLGILIPELHRRAGGRASFSAVFSKRAKGIGMAFRF
ncbi:MAG: phosphatase PAP2 family protein [Phaeodactylibacter sp.]|nr:phosphatase PAP2 family protein [Phaeodactylibacter sp.]